MKKLLLFAFAIFLCSIFTTLKAQTYFNKKYSYLPAIKSAVENTQGYLLATTKNTGTAQLICLVQTDFNGDTLWTSTAGLDKKKYDPVYITKGGYYNGYIVAGTVHDSLNESQYSSSNTDIFIAQFDANGKYMKMDVLGDPKNKEIVTECIMNADGSLVLAGGYQVGVNSPLLYCLKVALSSSSYQAVWSNSYSSETMGHELASVLIKVPGGYWLSYTDEGIIFSSFSHIVKLDESGNKKWSSGYAYADVNKVVTDGWYERTLAIVPLQMGNYLAIGTSSCANPIIRSKPLYLVGIDSTGKKLWSKDYGDSIQPTLSYWAVAPQVIRKKDSTFSVVGAHNSVGMSFCFDSNGDSLGMQTYKRTGVFNGILTCSNGGFLIYGSTGNNNQNAWVLHTDSLCGDTVAKAQIALSPHIDNVPMCYGYAGSISIWASNGTPPYQYLWSNGSTTANNSGVLANTYHVTVTDNVNNSASTSVTLTEPAPITITVVSQIPASPGKCDGAITVTFTGGTGTSYAVFWNAGSYKYIYPNSSKDSALCPGSNPYIVIVTDANGCTAEGSATISTTTTGIEELESSGLGNLSVWPNPVTNGILHTDGIKNANTIEFYNLLGEKVLQTKVAASIDVSSLSKGVYFVKIHSTGSEKVFKIMVQ